ncbi:MAG: FtsX-like permease family protein [Alphaproteobacteria bacterium]|nr:FtsX-like permease family protein [Alphaproteobacteria bacterium]
MNAIALQMLFGDRGKYIAMIIGIGFASLIMTQQPSIFWGLLTRTYAFIGDVAAPDIWVMDPGVQYVEEHKPMRDTDLARVRGVAGVAWAAPMYKSLMVAKLPDGSTRSIDLTGLDDATLIGAPPQIVEGSLESLRQADGVLVDKEAAFTRLRVSMPDGSTRPLAIGDVMEINDRRAVVVGYAKASRNFVLQPFIYTTYTRALTYAPQNRRQLTYVLVKAQEGVDIQTLADRISGEVDLLALTSDQFKTVTFDYWMKNTGIPINFGISVTLGFIVGAAVAGQAFFNFIRENLKQYAALKAMGLRSGVLVRMVLLQSLVVGLTGYGLGVGMTALFGYLMRDTVLAFSMHPFILIFALAGVFLIVAAAALLSIRQVIKIDPAVVFRG